MPLDESITRARIVLWFNCCYICSPFRFSKSHERDFPIFVHHSGDETVKVIFNGSIVFRCFESIFVSVFFFCATLKQTKTRDKFTSRFSEWQKAKSVVKTVRKVRSDTIWCSLAPYALHWSRAFLRHPSTVHSCLCLWVGCRCQDICRPTAGAFQLLLFRTELRSIVMRRICHFEGWAQLNSPVSTIASHVVLICKKWARAHKKSWAWLRGRPRTFTYGNGS